MYKFIIMHLYVSHLYTYMYFFRAIWGDFNWAIAVRGSWNLSLSHGPSTAGLAMFDILQEFNHCQPLLGVLVSCFLHNEFPIEIEFRTSQTWYLNHSESMPSLWIYSEMGPSGSLSHWWVIPTGPGTEEAATITKMSWCCVYTQSIGWLNMDPTSGIPFGNVADHCIWKITILKSGKSI